MDIKKWWGEAPRKKKVMAAALGLFALFALVAVVSSALQ